MPSVEVAIAQYGDGEAYVIPRLDHSGDRQDHAVPRVDSLTYEQGDVLPVR